MDKEFTLKRLEACIKVMDAATERQFKLASFALAGNVGAILACALAVKDFRAGQSLAPEFAAALSWFASGAIAAVVSLAIVLLASELMSYGTIRRVRAGPDHADTQKEFFDAQDRPGFLVAQVFIYFALYGYAAYAFFRGVYGAISLIR